MALPPLLTRRLRPIELRGLDAFAALCIAAICVLAALAVPTEGHPHEPFWVSLVVGLAIGLPIAVRRRWTYTATLTITIASMVALGGQLIPSFAAVGPAAALTLVFYTFGSVARDWKGFVVGLSCAVLISLSLLGPMLLSGQHAPPADSPSMFIGSVFGFVVVGPAATLGFAIGERRMQNTERNEHLLRQAAVEERLRVARELHDIIAHTMTLIVVKAAIGNHVAEASPTEARDALQVIESTGRAAMLEVRRVLNMLREDTPYAPAPGLNDLPSLVELASVGGVNVKLDVHRPDEAASERVPESVGLAVYRIVQEAITNVVKHAAPAQCHVRVVVGAEAVRIEVNDDGRQSPRADGATGSGDATGLGTVISIGNSARTGVGTAARTGVGTAARTSIAVSAGVGNAADIDSYTPGTGINVGHGLIGMRERVALHGGTFAAGPRPGGGFSVTALLPAGGGA